MELDLEGGPLPLDSESGALLLPGDLSVAAADVERFELGYYRAAGNGVGQFVNLPNPRIKLKLKDGTEHTLLFESGQKAVIALGLLQEWQSRAAAA